MRKLLFAATLLASSSAFCLNADELVNKNIEARGGLAAIKAINNIVATGKSTFGRGDFSIDLGFKMTNARPAKSRMEATFQGMTLVDAFDGKDAWMIQPFQGRKDPQRKSADEAKMAKINADLEGVLIDAKAKGYQVEYLGTEDVDGTNAHKLRVKLNETDSRTVYLDPDFFLEIRFEDRMQFRGAELVSKTDLGDYEKVNGVYFPFYIESNGQKISIESITANGPVNDAQFAFPAAPAAAPAGK